MASRSKIRQHTLREILNILGGNVQSGTEFQVHYNPEPITENPFPYPFRGNNTGLLLVLNGKFKIKINLDTFIAGSGDIILFSSTSIIHVLEMIEPVVFIGIVLTDEYALKHTRNFNDMNLLRFFSANERPVLPLVEAKRTIVFDLLQRMYTLNASDGGSDYYRNAKTFHYFNLLGLEVVEVYRAQLEKVDIKTSRKKDIIQSFLHLLSIHILRERSVQFYANKLFITPGYLSKLLKEASGNTARDVIEDAVVLEARNLLMDTSLPLAQIAEKLNFSDQSFFGKFFKKKMKVSPKSFRDKYK